MKTIAFVLTEYQQNILFAVCLQESIHIDILFIRKGIALNANVAIYVDDVIYYEDIPFSWRSVGKYYRIYYETIAPHLDKKEQYRMFMWSIVNPLSRYAINYTRCKKIDLIEDGSGSYMKWGLNNYNLGLKAFVASSLIFAATNIFSGTLLPLKGSSIRGWALFDNAYPDLKIEKKLIRHDCFRTIVVSTIPGKKQIEPLPDQSHIFLTSPYVEFGILDEAQYIDILMESFRRIISRSSENVDKIMIKTHPRTNIVDEKKRMEKVFESIKIPYEFYLTDMNVEAIAIQNMDKTISFYSLGSSSLYVIKALSGENMKVVLVENELINSILPTQKRLNKIYKKIGVELI